MELEEINGHNQPKNQGIKQKLTVWASMSVSLATLCGCFQYGYALGSVNAASIPIRNFIEKQYMVRYNQTISKQELDVIWVFLVSSFPLGGIVGCFLVVPAVKKFGKLRSMWLLHTSSVVAGLLMGLSGVMASFEVIIIARGIIGIVSSSVATGMVPMYIVEVIPQKSRGIFGGLLSFNIGFGLLVSNVLGHPQVLGTATLWPLLLSLNGAPSFAFLFICHFLAESPRTLYLTRSDREGAEVLLKKLRKSSDVGAELETLRVEAEQQDSAEQLTTLQLFRLPSLRLQLIAVMVLGVSQQLTGLNGVIIYMNNLFIQAGVPPDAVAYCSIGVTTLLVTVTLCAVPLMDRKGRKPLLLSGLVIEGISLILLTVTVELQNYASWLPYLSLVFATCFLVGFAIGPGPVVFLMVAEFFPQTTRPAAMTVATVCVFTAFFITTIVWPYMQTSMGGYAYLPFALVALSAATFVLYAVPETKNQTFIDTQRAFQSRSLRCLAKKRTVAGDEVIMREATTTA